MGRWLESFVRHWPRGLGFLINFAVIVSAPLMVLALPLALLALGLDYVGLIGRREALRLVFGTAALIWVPWIVGAWKADGFKL